MSAYNKVKEKRCIVHVTIVEATLNVINEQYLTVLESGSIRNECVSLLQNSCGRDVCLHHEEQWFESKVEREI